MVLPSALLQKVDENFKKLALSAKDRHHKRVDHLYNHKFIFYKSYGHQYPPNGEDDEMLDLDALPLNPHLTAELNGYTPQWPKEYLLNASPTEMEEDAADDLEYTISTSFQRLRKSHLQLQQKLHSNIYFTQKQANSILGSMWTKKNIYKRQS